MNGTKRHIAVDTIGMLLAVLVTAAGVQDRDGAMPLLKLLRAACPRIACVWADGGYAGALVSWAARHLPGLRLTIVKRSDTAKGFVVLHRRWCVERTCRGSPPGDGACGTTNAATTPTRPWSAGR